MKYFKRVLTGIVIVSVIFAAGCASQNKVDSNEVRKYADTIAEDILTAGNAGDYVKFSKEFDDTMKKAIPEKVFQDQCKFLNDRIGTYVSKEFVTMKKTGKYLSVIYKAKFTNEPKGVSVNVTFEDKDGKHYVAGLFYDSPNLRKK